MRGAAALGGRTGPGGCRCWWAAAVSARSVRGEQGKGARQVRGPPTGEMGDAAELEYGVLG